MRSLSAGIEITDGGTSWSRQGNSELRRFRMVRSLGKSHYLSARHMQPVVQSKMDKSALLKRIATDPAVCSGKPCVKGRRIWVSLILDLLADGASTEELLAEYPGLVREDILACIAYGAAMTRDRYVEISG